MFRRIGKVMYGNCIRNVFTWAIALFAVVLVAMAFYETVTSSFSLQLKCSDSLAWITSFIAIANALLLFATLQSQNNGIVTQRKNADMARFETTFFNLLQSHRHLAEDICVYRSIVDKENTAHLYTQEYKGRHFFTMAINDICSIESNLLSQSPISYYNQNNCEGREEALNRRLDDPLNTVNIKVEGDKLYKYACEELVNKIYKITEEDKVKCKMEPHYATRIFERTMKGFYEQYERSLTYMLEFIKESEHDMNKYVKILYSQLSMNEYHFIMRLMGINDHLLYLLSETEFYINAQCQQEEIDRWTHKVHKLS